MKLHALRLNGFKSFADRTEIVFHDGITAVVGPNGCGKSNISDAIRWVLGEQRPTAIRGARMEEAIFQGTVTRRPVNRGSVTIAVTNHDGVLPVAFPEVEISRTVYRDGGSDYSLNRSACRLRDIQDLCRDTGLGANAYAIIENRMIDAILSDRAEERRGLFEEAAGIGKYKDRRRAASRRLERAELDLQRLEDLITEVQSKVRSLSRQKGKAERFRELRFRRLNVEVAAVTGQLSELETRLTGVEAELSGRATHEAGLRAAISAAEGRLEALRLERLEAERARAAAAAGVGEIREDLVRWEREIAVVEERAVAGARRLEQISAERSEESSRAERATREVEELSGREGGLIGQLEGLREALGLGAGRVEEARGTLATAREAVNVVEGRERDVALRVAQLQGDASAAEARGAELEARVTHLEQELLEARRLQAEVAAQGDLFTDRVAALEDEAARGRAQLEELLNSLTRAREVLREARAEEMRVRGLQGELGARASALRRMEKDQEGMDPAVQKVLGLGMEGVVGILADAIEGDPDLSRTVEAVLGAHLKALVVEDSSVAVRLAHWFRDEWKGGGGLIVLPLDRVPDRAGSGSLLDRLELSGPGAPWARVFLDGVDLVAEDSDAMAAQGTGRLRVGSGGGWVEAQGVFRVGNPFGSGGILERRDRLRELEVSLTAASEAVESATEERVRAEAEVTRLESQAEAARAALRTAEDAFREASAREAARSEQSARMERSVAELEGQITLSRSGRDRAAEQAREGLQERDRLLQEEEGLRVQRTEAREQLDRVAQEWEAVRSEESRLTVELTRLEGELTRIQERSRDFVATQAAARLRAQTLEQEGVALADECESIAAIREEGRLELTRLFALRDEAEQQFGVRDRHLVELQEAVSEAERKVRDARATERETSDRRHARELERQELEGRIGRIRDRLEGEWGRSFDQLVAEADPVEGTEEELRAELREVVEALERLGPVNMLAVEEHEEENQRLEFLAGQRDDLVAARNDLRAAIREINQTATTLFADTFEAIRTNFRETFQKLFQGGECDLWLTDPDDPLESDVEIHAAPRGKRTQRIDLLSGGERALTALSLLFGIYLVKPSPFCVLDEVDAPLDESNIGRFIRLLQEFKSRTQFVVITHNPRTIEAADWIYGVTMEEPGVSTIVGVRLEEALEVASA